MPLSGRAPAGWPGGWGDRFHIGVAHYWLPCGFFIFLTGLFWAPERHNYKVIMNLLVLLPCLLVILHATRWSLSGWSRYLFSALCIYLLYFVVVSAYRQPADAVDYLKWSALVLIFVLGMGACMRIAERRLIQLLVLSVWGAVAAILYTICRDWADMLELAEAYRLTGYGALYNPLRTGHLLGVFSIIALWACWKKPAGVGPAWSYRIAAALCLCGVLLTGSRAPTAALTCTGLLLILLLSEGKRRWQLLSILVAAAAVTFLVFGDRLLLRGLSYRPEIWTAVIEASRMHFWLGAGLSAELSTMIETGDIYTDPHNVLLAALYHGGMVGLSLFLLLFGTALAGQWRERRRSPLMLLALALQMYGLLTLQFDGGSLIGRPTDFWFLYWLPMVIFLQARSGAGPGRRNSNSPTLIAAAA